MRETPFKIFSASAGSGKTFTLVKAYLKIILGNQNHRNFRQILGVTFTNKAVNEMKQRILGSLYDFGKETCPEKAKPLFDTLGAELGLSEEVLRNRSRQKLKEILHNYGFFDISTIDKFNHRLIRTFAKDLKLPGNFEVVLDTDALLEEAIDRLLQKTGTDKELTSVLIAFALDKADDDKHWEIGADLSKIGKLLFLENQRPHLALLEDKTLADFLSLRKFLIRSITDYELKMQQHAEEILKILERNGLVYEDFRSGWFPKFVSKIAERDFVVDFKANWKQNFGQEPLYTKGCPEPKKLVIDRLFPEFTNLFIQIRASFFLRALLKNAYGNSVPLTVLNAIQQEVKALENEREQLPISSFNHLISEEIKDQPAPYIYERLGEKYRHYFIDEFQDTSLMQWNNLIPLIANALESQDEKGKTGSLTLVGDAKQAIYRWRGGRAEQFLNLINLKTNPFTVSPEIRNLPRNYRSHAEIIRFNNSFFKSISPFLKNTDYQSLFAEGTHQKTNAKKDGYVQLEFLPEEEDINLRYCTKVVEIITEVLGLDFRYRDICILTRKRKQALLLSTYLTEQRIPVVSSETLLLNSNGKIRFLICLLHFSYQPEELEYCYQILYYLAADSADKHDFIEQHINTLSAFLLKNYGFDADFILQNSVYDGLEYAIRQFELAGASDAYLNFLLDEVLDLERKKGSGISIFLDHWKKNKDKLSIVAPETTDAVRVMTIHQAKGLEFAIVLFPFADTKIYEEIDPKLWLPVDAQKFCGFQELLINKKQEVRQYSAEALCLYDEEQEKLELDAFNLLYVALTRAVCGLYILTEGKKQALEIRNPLSYGDLFNHFTADKAANDDGGLLYSFGRLPQFEDRREPQLQESAPFIYTLKNRADFDIHAKSGMLWDTEREEAIQSGNLLHALMELITVSTDVDKAFEALILRGDLSEDQAVILRPTVEGVVTHPKLATFYSGSARVLNEAEIIAKNGLILRPDRVVLEGKKASVIDYKTGGANPGHRRQIQSYAEALEDMGYHIDKKVIIYISEKVIPEFI